MPAAALTRLPQGRAAALRPLPVAGCHGMGLLGLRVLGAALPAADLQGSILSGVGLKAWLSLGLTGAPGCCRWPGTGIEECGVVSLVPHS